MTNRISLFDQRIRRSKRRSKALVGLSSGLLTAKTAEG